MNLYRYFIGYCPLTETIYLVLQIPVADYNSNKMITRHIAYREYSIL
jgi:hypothetical protein